jgi:hypothetical protein
MISMTWTEYLKSARTLSSSEVKEREAKHDKARGVIVPDDHHNTPSYYGAAAH